MCKLFVNADPALYTFQTRSIRLRGVATSLRLEKQFWDVLAEIGARDAMTVPQLIARLYDELMATGADLNNFASFLRVCCTRYLSLQRFGLIPSDPTVPIRSLNADSVLAAERAHVRRCEADAHACPGSPPWRDGAAMPAHAPLPHPEVKEA